MSSWKFLDRSEWSAWQLACIGWALLLMVGFTLVPLAMVLKSEAAAATAAPCSVKDTVQLQSCVGVANLVSPTADGG